MNKVRINFSLTEEAHALLRYLAEQRGISMNALLEILIREEAKRRAVRERRANTQEGESDV